MASDDAAKQAQAAAINDLALIAEEPAQPAATKKKKDYEKLLKEREQKKKKLQMQMGIGALVVIIIGYYIMDMMKPVKADDRYGICYTILELNIPYPHTLNVNEYRNRLSGAITLWFTHTDAFGQFRMEDITCNLQRNKENGQYEIRDIQVHKVSMSDQEIRGYNDSLVYLRQYPRILNMPYDLSGTLSGLYFDTNSFWNVQLNIGKSY